MDYLSGKKIETVVKMLYDYKRYSLSDDLLDLVKNTSQHLLLTAPAGGTKTTTTQVVIPLAELDKVLYSLKKNIDLDDISNKERSDFKYGGIHCFVYNKHNVSDIKNIRDDIYSDFCKLGLFSSDPSDDFYVRRHIGVSTIHSYALNLVKEYSTILNVSDYITVTDYALLQPTFTKAISLCCNKLSDKKVVTILTNSQTELEESYNLYVNLLLHNVPVEEIDNPIFLYDLEEKNISLQDAVTIFKYYASLKNRFKYYDFNDFILLALKLLKNDEIKKEIQDKFQFVIIDEVQDLTKLMFYFYSQLIGENTRTLAIGDSDQTIFEFNGASPDNILNYEELTGLKVTRLNMVTNRRCADKTFAYANYCRNKLGDNKFEINLQRKGGKLALNFYNNQEDENEYITNLIETLPSKDTAVLFRTRQASILLSRELSKRNISAVFNSSMTYFDLFLYRRFLDIVEDVILFTHRSNAWKSLRYVLSVSSNEWFDFLELDRDGVPQVQPDVINWTKLDLLPLLSSMPTSKAQIVFEQFETLKAIMKVKEHENVASYFQQLYQLVLSANKFIISKQTKSNISLAEQYINEDFNKELPINIIIEQYIKYKNAMFLSYRKNKQVPIISTLHVAKGSEYDNVILASMTNVRSEEDNDDIIKSELRLYYVGGTRQRDNLILSTPANKKTRHFTITDELIEIINKQNLEVTVPTEKEDKEDTSVKDFIKPQRTSRFAVK